MKQLLKIILGTICITLGAIAIIFSSRLLMQSEEWGMYAISGFLILTSFGCVFIGWIILSGDSIKKALKNIF